MIKILEAAVYCGTYNKYNNGSIFGDWIKLADYPSKRKFLEACKELHKDEHDPEFMFQDWENIPTSMVSESYIDDEVWHVINSIKKHAMDKVDDFYSWCDDNGAEQDYEALKEFMGYKSKDKKATNCKKKDDGPTQMTKDEIRALLMANLGESNLRWIDSHVNDASHVDIFQGKAVMFYKPRIKTEFPFDDENEYEMKIYHNFTEDYFIADNMRRNEELRLLDFFEKKGSFSYGCRELYLAPYYSNGNIWSFTTLAPGDENDPWHKDYIKVTEEEKEHLHKVLLNEKAKFEKRLHSYLKRYGLSKIRTWSYYANA